MKCPLMRIPITVAGEADRAKIDECIKEECAWWDWDFDQCVVKSIAFNLWAVRSELSDFRAKIPHAE